MRVICRHPGMTDIQGNWEWEPDPTAPSVEEVAEILWRILQYIQQPEGLDISEVELKDQVDRMRERLEE